MAPNRATGYVVCLCLIVLALAYLPPVHEREWLADHCGVSIAFLPVTLHVTYVKLPLFCAMAVALLVWGGAASFRERSCLRPILPEMLLLAVGALLSLSVLWAPWRRGCLFPLVPALFGMAWAIALGRRMARGAFCALVLRGVFWVGVATAAVGLVAFLVMALGDPGLLHDPTFRLAVPHRNNSNFTACILITPVLLAWHAGVRGGGRRLKWVALALLLSVSLVLTRSASAFCGLVVALVALGALAGPERWRWRIVGIAVALAVTVAVWVLAVPGGVARCVDFALQGTRAVRYLFWQDAWGMVKARPIAGWGVGGFFYGYPQFRQPGEFLYPQLRMIVGDHAHNELLNLAVELGLLGVTAACAFVVVLIKRAAEGIAHGDNRRWEQALVAGTIGMLAQSLFSPALRAWDVAPFFWTQVGLLLAMARRGEAGAQQDVSASKGRVARQALWVVAAALGVVGWIALCCPDWRAERALAKGLVPDVSTPAGAAGAAPELRTGAEHAWNPISWFNAKRRFAICRRTEGRYDEAIKVLEGIDAAVPNLGTTRLFLGELHFARYMQTASEDDYECALSCLESYASANSDARVYLRMAQVLCRAERDPARAFACLKVCLALDPGNAAAERLLGEVRARLRALQDAVD